MILTTDNVIDTVEVVKSSSVFNKIPKNLDIVNPNKTLNNKSLLFLWVFLEKKK